LAEFGTVYRYEQSGELHGLTRVRGFTQDDAHLFCRPDQVKEEFMKVIDLVLLVLQARWTSRISRRRSACVTRTDRSKYIGSDENWEKAEQAIIEAAAEKGLKTVVEYGEAAFYGPKLDFMVKDALGRRGSWAPSKWTTTCPSVSSWNTWAATTQKHRPVMIHRAPFGSWSASWRW
jgi:threonyl-tRNA synthetase